MTFQLAWSLIRFVFDSTVQNLFSRIPVSSSPVGRSWHTLTAVSDASLFLFGGLSVDCKPMSENIYPLYTIIFLVALII